jgi:hypothetical protein
MAEFTRNAPPKSYALANSLVELGYVVGLQIGVPVDQRKKNVDNNVVGVLRDAKEPEGMSTVKKWLRRAFVYDKKTHLGNIWTESSHRGAQEDTQWVFEVYGMYNLGEAMDLSQKLERIHEVPIRMILADPKARTENFTTRDIIDSLREKGN